jgi:hypothetical protein
LNRPLWSRYYTRTFRVGKSADAFFRSKERIFSRKRPFFSEKSQREPSSVLTISPFSQRLCAKIFHQKARDSNKRPEKSLWTPRLTIVTIAESALADRRRAPY